MLIKLNAERFEDGLKLSVKEFYEKYKGYPTENRRSVRSNPGIADERLMNWPAAMNYIEQDRVNILDPYENIIIDKCESYLHLE